MRRNEHLLPYMAKLAFQSKVMNTLGPQLGVRKLDSKEPPAMQVKLVSTSFKIAASLIHNGKLRYWTVFESSDTTAICFLPKFVFFLNPGTEICSWAEKEK